MRGKGSISPHALFIAVCCCCLFGAEISLAQAKSQELTRVNAARAEAAVAEDLRRPSALVQHPRPRILL